MTGSRINQTTVLLLLVALLCQGCAGPTARLQYLIGDSQSLSHYEDMATAIEFPVEEDPRQTDPDLFRAPRSVRDLSEVQHRPMTLEECIRTSLARSAILRDDSSFSSPANPLMANPAGVTSVYDTAIQETGFLFGNRGPEAALADFDALLTNSLQLGRSEDPQNSPFFNVDSGQTLVDETAQWSTRIEKPLANSGTFSVQHDWNYSQNNVTNRLFPSAYTGFLQGEYRQPLLAGSGTEFTRIAGPLGQTLRGVSGVAQGVLISRINSDISLVDFEQSVMTVVRDVENRYWDLYLALRLYDSEIDTFKDLLRFWNRLKSRKDTPASYLAQTEARIFEADARIKGSLADVLDAEARLRRLMGLAISDGEFVVPAEDPSEARLAIDWRATLTEALAHRPELRRQKWEIRSLELQLAASRNLARPRLDMVSQYRVNGFGDNLFGDEDDDGVTDVGYASAYESMTQGFNTTWNLGLSFSMPIGLRLARAQVRNYELRLAKSKAVLVEQEKEIAYELNSTLLNLDRWYELAESSTKRLDVAVTALNASENRLETEFRVDYSQLGQALDAKISKRDAEQAYLRSIVEYNKSIIDLEFRKGTTLVNQSIFLAEGEWNPKAYEDARKRGEAMSHSLDNTHLQSEPLEFVGGPAPAAWESQSDPNRPHVAGLHSGHTSEPHAGSPGSPVPAVPAPQLTPPGVQSPNTTPGLFPQPAPPASPDEQLDIQPPQPPLPMPTPPEQPLPGRPQDRITRRPGGTSGGISWLNPAMTPAQRASTDSNHVAAPAVPPQATRLDAEQTGTVAPRGPR